MVALPTATEDVIEALERRFAAASLALRGARGTAKDEGIYAVAYQALVSAGLRTQLRGKYRL